MSIEAKPGAEATVTLTKSAAKRIESLLTQPENVGKTLRLLVEQGGCSGMQYSMAFDEPRFDDVAVEASGISVLVDPFSAQYVRGAVVDLGESLPEGGFRISNPNARQTCGCGKSFTA